MNVVSLLTISVLSVDGAAAQRAPRHADTRAAPRRTGVPAARDARTRPRLCLR